MLNIILGSCFMAGLLLAGSDGPMFPLINIGGTVMVLICSMVLIGRKIP